ncbi:hypothetical protein [Eisenbergiella massiliensis]|uniref:hypothetical protein n=1 Tax=Eisenbergiella massiliensis TaxID=1720294 RepID=UPI0023F58F5C|nr:hypothetical protein [Eisenbergiella massiliensis]
MFEKKNEKGISCEDCMHYAICGQKDHMRKAVEQVANIKIEKGDFLKITVKCTEFREIVAMPRGSSTVRKMRN